MHGASLSIAETEVSSPRTSTRVRTPLRRLTRNGAPVTSIKGPSARERDALQQTKSGTADSQSPSANAYDALKKYYHRSAAVRVVGRTAERAAIQSFWRDALTGDGPRVLYICGNPGTGKTALIEEMLPELLEDGRIGTTLKVNCMMHEDPRTSIDEISQAVRAKKSRSTLEVRGGGDRFQASLDCVEEHLRQHNTQGITLLILDEVDQIASRDSSLLERIFKLPYAPSVQLLVIGIANAIDLSIRHIGAPLEQVQVLNFAPYSVEDIVRILIARAELVAREVEGVTEGKQGNSLAVTSIHAPLPGGSWQQLIVPVAIEMCARKVSSVSDLRKALEIMRDAISLAEKEAGMSALSGGSCPEEDNATITTRKFLPITLAHVTRAMDRIFGSTVRTASRHVQMIQDLNLHQKLLLATLHRLLRDSLNFGGSVSNNGEGGNSMGNGGNTTNVNPSSSAPLKPTVQSLFDRYTASARSYRIIDAVGRSEFNDLVANTESMGIISLIAPGKRRKGTGGAVSSDSRVLLSLPLEDVHTGLCTNPVLASLL